VKSILISFEQIEYSLFFGFNKLIFGDNENKCLRYAERGLI